eukprot:6004640-Prymnesium_polylepis.1
MYGATEARRARRWGVVVCRFHVWRGGMSSLCRVGLQTVWTAARRSVGPTRITMADRSRAGGTPARRTHS